MDVKALIHSGHLEEARESLAAMLRKDPEDTTSRAHLFQVLLFMGEWDKAMVHLNALDAQEKKEDPAYQVYQDLIRAQRLRHEVYSLKTLPIFWPKAPSYADTYREALDSLAKGDTEVALTLFGCINAIHPTTTCIVNGEKFKGFANTDSVLTYVLEAFFFDSYYWIPIETIKELTIHPPSTLLDLMWAKAAVSTWENKSLNVFLPVLYPETPSQDNVRIKMGKETQWRSFSPPFIRGFGQQVFQAGEKDIALYEIQTAAFEHKKPDSSGGAD